MPGRIAHMRSLCESDPGPGVLAYVEGGVAGWCSVAPKSTYRALVNSRTIPHVEDEDVWSVVCFVVRPGFRRRGLMHRLLDGAIVHAQAMGAPALEGYPVEPGEGRVDQTSGYVGTVRLFEAHGFHRGSRSASCSPAHGGPAAGKRSGRVRAVDAAPRPFRHHWMVPSLISARLVLTPVLAPAAAALGDDRPCASALLEAELPAEWPHPGLLDVIRDRAAGSTEADHFGVWAIIDRAEATVVGDIGFKGPPDMAATVEIGYSVLAGWRGRGYAVEAADAIVKWALSRPRVRAVVAKCAHDNVPSVRTLERARFARAGETGGEVHWRYTGAVSTIEQVPFRHVFDDLG